jgi:hypothetical protein
VTSDINFLLSVSRGHRPIDTFAPLGHYCRPWTVTLCVCQLNSEAVQLKRVACEFSQGQGGRSLGSDARGNACAVWTWSLERDIAMYLRCGTARRRPAYIRIKPYMLSGCSAGAS